MEVEAEVSVDADAEVVVHNEHLRIILIRYGCDVSHATSLILAGLLLRMEHHRPSIQPDLIGFDDVTQQVKRIFTARVTCTYQQAKPSSFSQQSTFIIIIGFIESVH